MAADAPRSREKYFVLNTRGCKYCPDQRSFNLGARAGLYLSRKEGRAMRKIEFKTESGIIETGWIKSSETFWFYDEQGKQIRWTWAEGDALIIKEDVDACDVPVVIREAVGTRID